MLSTDILTINDRFGSLQYSSKNGVFFVYRALDGMISSVHGCRVSFGFDWKRQQDIGFNAQGADAKRLHAFIDEIETRLDLAQRTTVYQTSIPSAIVLHVSPFWRANETRRSFFSLFLRCGVVYYRGDFDQAIKDYTLASKIEPAIKWFLAGNVCPTYRRMTRLDWEGYGGVKAEFDGIETEAELSKKLVKPAPTT